MFKKQAHINQSDYDKKWKMFDSLKDNYLWIHCVYKIHDDLSNFAECQQKKKQMSDILGRFEQRRHLGWETENISGILHKYCVSLWIFLSFWNQWDPMQLPKSIWAKKSAVFSYLGSHMWDNTKIQKNEKYWPKMKMKNFPFFGQKSIIHS